MEFHNDLFSHLFFTLTVGSSKADSQSGSPSIFISWHRAWHLMDQSSASCYHLRSPIPLALSPVSPECTQPAFLHIALVTISSLFHIFKSWGHILCLHINSLISNMWCSNSTFLPETRFHMAFGLPLSALHWSHWLLLLSLFWWFLLFSLSSKCQSVPAFPFLICTYSINLMGVNITHIMKSSNFPSPAYKSAKAILSNKTQLLQAQENQDQQGPFLQERKNILVFFHLSRSGFVILHFWSYMRSLV